MANPPATETHAGCRVMTLPRKGLEELFLTRMTGCGTDPAEAVRFLNQREGTGVGVLRADVFGPLTGQVDTPPPAWDWPVTWVVSDTSESAHLGGVHVHGIRGAHLTPIHLDGRVVGAFWETEDAIECMLGDIRPSHPSGTRPEQARATFELMEDALAQAGMDFSHVVRTWLFLDDILAWYPEFNVVRTDFFRERGVFDRLVPASTGIGGSNPAGTAMVTAVFAVKPKNPAVSAFAVPSPLQCPALEYGSSFSRAAEVSMPDHRRLFISGTASIDPDGTTCHVGDIDGQVARTCDVVEAILESRDMGWDDVTRATAYVRYPHETPAFQRYWDTTGRAPLPVIIANNTICRDDLLFELEVDALVQA